RSALVAAIRAHGAFLYLCRTLGGAGMSHPAGHNDNQQGRPGPLEGIRVLDLSRVLAGPWCTQTMADLGAEVWKIEAPGQGDDTRTWLPPDLDGESTYFMCTNRSKQSMAVNFK